MNTIFILFTACISLLGNNKCYDKELQLSIEEVLTPIKCMQIGQLELSKWIYERQLQSGQDWKIIKFSCESEEHHKKRGIKL